MTSQLLNLKLLSLLKDTIDTTYRKKTKHISALKIVAAHQLSHLSALSPVQIWCTETGGSFINFAATVKA